MLCTHAHSMAHVHIAIVSVRVHLTLFMAFIQRS